ncbi:MAG: hypothetical protein HFE63_01755 [Clostridiales bacterium]|nr:hypothetical protein [Clostridiales bacterium]
MTKRKKYIYCAALICVCFALAVWGIFTFSEASYKLHNNDEQVLFCADDASIEEAEQILKIYTFANEIDDYGNEERRLCRLEVNKPVYAGRLREKVLLSSMPYAADGYNDYYIYQGKSGDDVDFFDPIITLVCDGTIEVKYSIDRGWLEYDKSDDYKISEVKGNRDSSAYGSNSLTVRPYVTAIVEAEQVFEYCSSDMKNYNEYARVNLRDICSRLPAKYSSIYGNLYITHLLVNVYDSADTQKINASADIKISYFTGWKSGPYYTLVDDGFAEALEDYELYPYIKLEIVDYSQIESFK